MDLSRAKEILDSTDHFDVFLDGEPVWIENVEASSDRVRVHMENDPQQKKNVSPQELQELH